MNLIGETVADLELTINKDIYQIASSRFPFNNEQKQKYISSIFTELINNLDKLEPSIKMLFTGYSGNCFNNKTQFLRKVVLKCLWLSINPKYRSTISKLDIDKLDKPEYLPIYKQIFNIFQEFKCYYTCLWFFFQVPNYINFNIQGFRIIYESMLDYAIENWSNTMTIKDYITITKGSTFYYNLVYHGLSNKSLITKWNILLAKIIPDLAFKPNIRKLLKYNSSKNKKINICFISDKLQHYTSVFRDRIGIITGLNPDLFDVSIAIYSSNLINEESIKLSSSWHPVIYGFLKRFIDTNKIILLKKTDIIYNRNKLIGRFNIIFYPDIGMKQSQTLLAHSRLAPVQITTWGHSDTSGITEIDYYITSKYFERCDDISLIKNNYIEKPILLTSLGTYYFNPLKIAAKYFNYSSKLLNIINNEYNYEIDMDKLSSDKIIIGCLQSHYKINENFEKVIKKILDLLTPYYDIEIYLSNSIPFNKLHLQRLNNTLKTHSTRIKWFSNLNQKQWFEIMSKCYLMLDPFPFGGCNTSLEAFSLNIPVIAYPSNNISGRFTYGFYNKMKVNTNIVISYKEEDYINNTVLLIKNKGEYYKLVKEIYMNKNKLFEEIESIEEYEKLFKILVQK
jgi:predicted O-linked N-acetylglucosamine transferase (SPINDLY family)